MKKTILFALVVVPLTIYFVTSCKKHKNDITTYTPPLTQLFADIKPSPQNYSVQAGVFSTIQGVSGTVLNFYPNSFKDASGNIITSGTVNIQLTEMYKPGDMIRNHTSSTANELPLQSGGQINIVAEMNGTAIYANKYSIGFKQSVVSNTHMQLFYGNNTNPDSVKSWTLSDTTKLGNSLTETWFPFSIAYDTDHAFVFTYLSNMQCYFNFDSCVNFDFTNCDCFHIDSLNQLIPVNVIMPDTSFNTFNSAVYLILPTINSVLTNDGQGWDFYDSTTHTISLLSSHHKSIVPINMSFKFVVISIKNGNYYYYETSGTTPSTVLTITAQMTPDTKNGVIAKLDAL